MEVLLDTSFIVSCVKEKIDFIKQLEQAGFVVKVPHEVIEELKDLKLKSDRKTKDAVKIALMIVLDKSVKKIRLGHKSVDDGLIEKGKDGYYIASLDRVIKHSVEKRVVLFKDKRQVGVE